MIISHHFAGGAYVKETRFQAGEIIPQHSHPHAHLAVLSSGIVTVSVEGGHSGPLEGPCVIEIAAHRPHTVQAHTDVTWCCVWATDDTDPETVDATILGGN